MTESLTPYEPTPTTPASMIMTAIGSGASPDTLERLWALQEKYEANEARKAYHKAMAEFKRNPPEIEKDARVDYTSQKGRTQYNHATLGNVSEKINRALSEHGLSATWKTDQANGQIKVTCTITHELGYSESTSLESPPDISGGKNGIQAIGSTVSYLQRYTILALTGLSTKEQDDDGRKAQAPKVDLSRLSPEYKSLMSAKNIFPEEYAQMLKDCGGEPANVEQYRMATEYIKRLVAGKEAESE